MSYYYMDKISISPDETFSLHLSKAGKQRSLVSAYTEALLRWQIIDSSCSSSFSKGIDSLKPLTVVASK